MFVSERFYPRKPDKLAFFLNKVIIHQNREYLISVLLSRNGEGGGGGGGSDSAEEVSYGT